MRGEPEFVEGRARRGREFAFVAVGPGRILAATDAGTFPIPLPPEAPSSVGPVAWLP